MVDVENINEIPEISQVLFVAAEVGNVEFLVKLIRFDFDLLWKIDNKRSIFHIAVEQRHESIFNLLIGSIRDIIVDGMNEDGSNIYIALISCRIDTSREAKCYIRSSFSNAARIIMVQGTYSYALSSKI